VQNAEFGLQRRQQRFGQGVVLPGTIQRQRGDAVMVVTQQDAGIDLLHGNGAHGRPRRIDDGRSVCPTFRRYDRAPRTNTLEPA
jgi:hypothetical protein